MADAPLPPSVRKSIAQVKRAANVAAETWLELTHEAYRRQGLATIARCHFPVRGKPGSMYPTGKGDCDFVGAVWTWKERAALLPVAFDLKVLRNRADYSFDPIEKPETLKQIDFLIDIKRHGGVAFLGVLDPDEGALWMLGGDCLNLLRADYKLKFRSRDGDKWIPSQTLALLSGAIVVRVPEHSVQQMAKTGIRYDWRAFAHLMLP